MAILTTVKEYMAIGNEQAILEKLERRIELNKITLTKSVLKALGYEVSVEKKKSVEHVCENGNRYSSTLRNITNITIIAKQNGVVVAEEHNAFTNTDEKGVLADILWTLKKNCKSNLELWG